MHRQEDETPKEKREEETENDDSVQKKSAFLGFLL